MQKYQNTVQNRNGYVVPYASVLVQTYPALVAASVYSDNGVTPASNPLTADINGNFAFYANSGHYTLAISGSNLSPITMNDVILQDISSIPLPILHTSTAAGATAYLSTAGASTQSSKFIAFTNMLINSLTATASTIGTGTATSFVLGNVGTGNAPAFLRITNNGTTQVSTLTGTYQLVGQYVLPAGATPISTGGVTIKWTPNTAYSTAIGTSGASVNALTTGNNWALVNGGIPMLAGDQGYVVKGADATEVLLPWQASISLS